MASHSKNQNVVFLFGANPEIYESWEFVIKVVYNEEIPMSYIAKYNEVVKTIDQIIIKAIDVSRLPLPPKKYSMALNIVWKES